VVSILDLGSTNGTIVDGRRVQHAILGEGSTVVLGNTTIRVHLADAVRPDGPDPTDPWRGPATWQPTAPPEQPGYAAPRPDHAQASPSPGARRDNDRDDPAVGPGGWW
jgi:hypothetical protein